MNNDIELAQDCNIIPRDVVPMYVSPETYQITDPESGATWVYYNGEPVVELGQKKALDNVWVHPEPGFQHGRCKMIKSNGERCRQPVRAGWTVCSYHGAGTSDRPAGRPPTTGIYSRHLPTRYMQDYEDSLNDPNSLSMRNAMALLDARLGELLQKLETADSISAWNRVAVCASMLFKLLDSENNDNVLGQIREVAELLADAVTNHRDDRAAWGELIGIVDERRKVADVERRRIEAAKKYLTLPEANAMMAFFVSSVMRHCSSPQERARISEDMRMFSAAREA